MLHLGENNCFKKVYSTCLKISINLILNLSCTNCNIYSSNQILHQQKEFLIYVLIKTDFNMESFREKMMSFMSQKYSLSPLSQNLKRKRKRKKSIDPQRLNSSKPNQTNHFSEGGR